MLNGSLKVPGDKSITHRALIFASLVKGHVEIENLSTAQDCADTALCMQKLGLEIERKPDEKGSVTVKSPGLSGLSQPKDLLYVGNSGTTIRLLSGLLSSLPISCCLDGDESIRKRPMARVIEPLSAMGAQIEAREGKFAPMSIRGGGLAGRRFDLSVASAQVETCLLLAGLSADGRTTVATPHLVRDHTRRMFGHMAVPYFEDDGAISVERLSEALPSCRISVPADISSAAFFLVCAALLKGSDLSLLSVGTNPGRTLVLDALSGMGADIERLNERLVDGEPVADIRIRGGGRLTGITLGAADLPSGIDEIPILSLAGSLCEGEMVVEGASELRHKESDRLALLVSNLSANGADIEERQDGFVISGRKTVKGGELWETRGDHRMAMSGAIASLLFEQPVRIDDQACIAVSYPEFFQDLESVKG